MVAETSSILNHYIHKNSLVFLF